jgi:hypothetical protein
MLSDHEVYAAYDEDQRRLGRPRYAMSNIDNVCSPGLKCHFWEHSELVHVCHVHHAIHRCGPRCRFAVQDSEATTCLLTGMVVGTGPDTAEPYADEPRGGGLSASRPAKGPARKAKMMMGDQERCFIIEQAVLAVLCGTGWCLGATKAVRRQLPVPFVSVARALRLSRCIATYHKKLLRRHGSAAPGRKRSSLIDFTARMLVTLCSGHTVASQVLVPAVPWLTDALKPHKGVLTGVTVDGANHPRTLVNRNLTREHNAYVRLLLPEAVGSSVALCDDDVFELDMS